MFTGIVQSIGRLADRELRGEDQRLRFHTGGLALEELRPGDSIAVNGVCLTALELEDAAFAADVSCETLARTTLGQLAPGAPVNLEKALALHRPLGGHLVSGHVDATARVLATREEARSRRIEIALPGELAPCVAPKGAICVDGVSLTVNEVAADRFGVNIVPHTREVTIIGAYQVGTEVNLEVDLIARYVQRILACASPPAGPR